MFSAPSTEGTAVLGLSIKWTLQSSHKSIIDEQWYGILGQEEGKGRWEKWNWAGGGHWKGGSYLSKGRESGSLLLYPILFLGQASQHRPPWVCVSSSAQSTSGADVKRPTGAAVQLPLVKEQMLSPLQKISRSCHGSIGCSDGHFGAAVAYRTMVGRIGLPVP